MIRASSRRHFQLTAAFIALIVFGSSAARPTEQPAQTTNSASEARPLGARTDLVRLDVSVLDKRGNFAGGLTQANFRVLDNGEEQPVVFFAPVTAPAHVMVMIETGPAVYLIHDEHLAAAFALVQGLDPADQVALVSYSDKPRSLLGFTSNKSEFLGALGSLQYMLGMGNLNFFDSLSAVVKDIAPTEGKSAIVLLTTGIDTSPASEWDRLVLQLQGTDVVIYSVALGGVLRGDQNAGKKRGKRAPKPEPDFAPASASLDGLTGFARADRVLKLLAQITGGRTYFPQSDEDFAPMYREIAAALRHQYVLGIAPVHDGKFHTLTVQVVTGSGKNGNKPFKKFSYRLFVRQGYLAPHN